MKAKDTYHHGDLRHEIIQEALFWIEKENIASLSLRGIARRLGVSHNAPYRHFPDKESLLVAIAEIGFDDLHQALQKALVDVPDDPQQRVEILGIAYIQYAVQNQAYYKVMFNNRQLNDRKYPNLGRLSEAAFDVLLDAIEIGQNMQVFILEDSRQ